jgi:tryptophan 2,3-dioxygenase
MQTKMTSQGNEGNKAPQEKKRLPLTYNVYLKVEELKRLQKPQSDPPHHDEMLFIVIHQAYELWFKQILHELDTVFELLAQDKILRSTFYLRRVVAILKLLVQQIHLLETMSPRDFLGFRHNLNPASGFQSSQFREIEFCLGLKDERMLIHFEEDSQASATLLKRYESPSLGDAFWAALAKRGFETPAFKPTLSGSELDAFYALLKEKGGAGKPPTGIDAATSEEADRLEEKRILELLRIYKDPEAYNDLYELAETLFDIDELIFFWRTHHVTVVERMIGFKRGTGGSEGVAYLRSTAMKRCFPELWKVRTYLER